MSDKPENPQAHPGRDRFGDVVYGMTLRDYFAGKTLGAITGAKLSEGWELENLAEASYAMADAMLKERSK